MKKLCKILSDISAAAVAAGGFALAGWQFCTAALQALAA